MQGGPTPREIEELVQRLEAFLNGVNQRFLQEARIDPEGVAAVFVKTQAQLLRFDTAAQQRFEQAVEEARVKSLARSSFLMSCLLTSAVALKQFKREPRRVAHKGWRGRIVGLMQERATDKTALWTFTVASFYAVVGSAAYKRLVELREARGGVVRVKV